MKFSRIDEALERLATHGQWAEGVNDCIHALAAEVSELREIADVARVTLGDVQWVPGECVWQNEEGSWQAMVLCQSGMIDTTPFCGTKKEALDYAASGGDTPVRPVMMGEGKANRLVDDSDRLMWLIDALLQEESVSFNWIREATKMTTAELRERLNAHARCKDGPERAGDRKPLPPSVLLSGKTPPHPESMSALPAPAEAGPPMSLTFIVSGEAHERQAYGSDVMADVTRDVLKATRNTGRPPEDFEMRRENGALLDQSMQVGALNIATNEKLFLCPNAGWGGAPAEGHNKAIEAALASRPAAQPAPVDAEKLARDVEREFIAIGRENTHVADCHMGVEKVAKAVRRALAAASRETP